MKRIDGGSYFHGKRWGKLGHCYGNGKTQSILGGRNYSGYYHKSFALEDAKVEILKVTDYRTPMGSIVIGRVKDRGYIQIAGPQRVNEIKEVSQIMLNFGADFVIIDGAIDRRSSAAPFISDGTILSTGLYSIEI